MGVRKAIGSVILLLVAAGLVYVVFISTPATVIGAIADFIWGKRQGGLLDCLRGGAREREPSICIADQQGGRRVSSVELSSSCSE